MSFRSLIDVLAAHESENPDRIVYTFLETGDVDGAISEMTYADLGRRVRAISSHLHHEGFAERKALLLYPPGLEFISGFLGCLAGSVVAVPAPLPQLTDLDRSLRRLRQMIADANIEVVLSTRLVIDNISAAAQYVPELADLTWIATEEISDGKPGEWTPDALEPDSIAFLQYTSGSTSAPRGVMVTHGNLMHNQQAIASVMGHTPEMVATWDGALMVSWLPVFHDMGLIGPVLQTVFTGMGSVLFSPLHFLQQPQRWLKAISVYRAHSSGAPNFGYELCLRPTSPEALAALDLQHWHVAFNGAEPVRAETLERFTERFSPRGFRASTFQPVYGLAEATLLVSGTPLTAVPTIIERPDGDDSTSASTHVVGAGKPAAGVEVVIAAVDGAENAPARECADDEIGEIWLAGPSVAAGYWGNTQRTEEVFNAALDDGRRGYLRTGDLGFLRGGELFVTGRHKDLLVIDGKNHYPQDLEQSVEGAHSSIRRGCIAAFSVDAGIAGEQPVIVAEVKLDGDLDFAAVKGSIRSAVSAGHGLALRDVVLIAPRTIFKTSSGKIQRQACRVAYINDEFDSAETQVNEVDPIVAVESGAIAEGAVTPEALQAWLVEAVAVHAHLDASAIDVDRPLTEFGLGSRGLVELVGQLSGFVGRELDPGLLFEYRTIALIVAALHPEDASVTDSVIAPVDRVRDESDPIVIVGVGCRFPGGVESMDGLWDLVAEARDATSEFPADRGWTIGSEVAEFDAPMTPCRGGFLDAMADFDAEFFHISPREAMAMDPQQRLMLEISWEALERAGIDPKTMAGTSTGVYTGVTYSDYFTRLYGRMPSEAADYISDNGTSSVISGRVAYTLGLEGPAVTVDTACSSSLVAIHLAAQAIRAGECARALAGGVTVMSTSAPIEGFARKRGLSADGLCKAFSEDADGTGFAEGAGVLVLERLSTAVASGHPVLAVLAGSAVNQDGASNGLTAPSGPAQERVIRQALADAGLAAESVDVVEAHGTGTALGDPIEARAILATYGQNRPSDRPLHLGSLKSNIGHTQAAAGVAGVIKMIAAMQHEVLPATLHVNEPSSRVDWSDGAVALLTESRPWSASDRPRRAGVSSFGVSGTNAHLILEQGSAVVAAGTGREALPVVPWVLSGVTSNALTAQAARLIAHLDENADVDVADVGLSLTDTRSTFAERAVVVGADRGELLDGLRSLMADDYSVDVVKGRAGNPTRPVFVFSGHGSQWAGMAVELYASSPVFAAQLRECAAVLDEFVDWSLLDVLHGIDGAPDVDALDVVQPALFAVMVSLTRLWESFGVRPAAVIGHSQGEIVAAHVAGALTLRDATRLVAQRGKALLPLSGRGGMATVALPVDQVRERIAPWADQLEIGALNSPDSTVVSGDLSAIDALLAQCEGDGIRARRVAIRYASHSRHVEAVRDELDAALTVDARTSSAAAFISTVTGDVLDTGTLDRDYWLRNVREPVQFEKAVRAAYQLGYRTFLEVGPHSVLTPVIDETLYGIDDSAAAHASGTLRRGDGSIRRFLTSVAALHVAGVKTDWAAYFVDSGARAVSLPTYAFQRQRYWLEPVGTSGDAGELGLTALSHPLLGAVVPEPGVGGIVVTGRISQRSHRWLTDPDHAGAVVFPNAGMVELALRAGDEVDASTLGELHTVKPMIVPEHHGLHVQVRVGAPDESGQRLVSIHSRSEVDATDEWVLHATGTLSVAAAAVTAQELTQWPPAAAEGVELGNIYAELPNVGRSSATRGLRAVWRRGADIFAEVALPESMTADAATFGIHPALLDSVIDTITLTSPAPSHGKVLTVTTWSGVTLHAVGASTLRAQMTAVGGGEIRIVLADGAGQLVAVVESVTVGERDAADYASPDAQRGESLLALEWTPVDRAGADSGVVTWSDIAVDDNAAQHDGQPILNLIEPANEDPAVDFTETVQAQTTAVLTHVQQWLSTHPSGTLVVATRGAVAVESDSDLTDLGRSPIWGLLRTAQTEHPGRVILVDVDDWDTAEPVVAGALHLDEPQFAVRAGALLVPRLARVAREAVSDEDTAPVLDPSGTVLITGGTGVLGGLIARHVVTRHGARNLVLASRRGSAAEGATELVAELSDLGARVSVVACDVSDRAAVMDLIGSVPADAPLTSVIHTAGVSMEEAFTEQGGVDVATVFGPKVNAAIHLHEATADMALSSFVLYSSTSGLLGAPRHATYGAANSFLDALAHVRRARGLAATAIAWGAWSQASGVTGHLGERDWARLSLAGLRPMATDEALELFDAAAAADRPLVVAVPVSATVMSKTGVVPTLFRSLVKPARRSADDGLVSRTSSRLAGALAGLSPDKQLRFVTSTVRDTAAAVLGYTESHTLNPETAFKDLGFDSLAAVELRNRLQHVTGVNLSVADVFNYPTASELARFLLSEVLPRDTVSAVGVPVNGASDDPVVIVSVGCRYPGGVESMEGLWDLVAHGRDAVSGLPTDRGWDIETLPGANAVDNRRGGFLDTVADFDPAFFRISPREALAMDPQQRLMLEISWEALERAGIDPTTLAGSSIGVFTGVTYSDYSTRFHGRMPDEAADYISEGTTSVASGRVAYVLGLEGPAVTVDTACSSSLVALHLAAQSVRSGECSMALAGGVTVMSTSTPIDSLARKGGLAKDGRCKAFSESADGTGFAEGAGVMLVERLSDARRLGHPVLAVVAGSAVNQDGASNGLTAPSGPSQEGVIRQALANAGLTADDVDVVEAHGTGTALGDPIEARALLATYGQDRSPERPLRLGSLKSNIGHTQAAAGVGGIIKMIAAMQHAVLPATLHADVPSSHVDWSSGAVELLTQAREWPGEERPRRAGVSAFGVSGTNAHVILEQPAPVSEGAASPRVPLPVVPVALSGASASALTAQAARLHAYLEQNPAVDLADVGLSLVSTRARFAERAVVLGTDRASVLGGLRALAEPDSAVDDLAADIVRGRAASSSAPVFIFPGQGSQWSAMAAELLETSPVFAAQMHECAAALSEYVEWSLLDVLREVDGAPDLEGLDVLHPVLFSVMVSLTRMWESFGVRPAAVIGHSQGEIAAAYVAGALTLPEAIKLVTLRARELATVGVGAMAVVARPVEEIEARMGQWAGRLEIGVVNSPVSTVVSGDLDAIEELTALYEAEGVRVTRVAVKASGHSHHIEPLRERMRTALDVSGTTTSEVAFLSTVTGSDIDTGDLDSEYWWRNVRGTVQFEQAVRSAYEQGYRTFVEVSPHPALTMRIRETLDSLGARDDVFVGGSLRRGDGGVPRFMKSVAELHVSGVSLDWVRYFADSGARTVDLPTYAFQRQRYWLDPTAASGDSGGFGLSVDHPLLGAAVPEPTSGGVVFTGRVSLRSHPWLADHAVWGSVLFPGTGFVELAIRAGDEVGATALRDLVLAAPMIIPEQESVQIQVVLGESDSSGDRAVSVYSRPQHVSGFIPWVRHAQGTLSSDPVLTSVPELTTWPPTGAIPVDMDAFYEELAGHGYGYGPSFQGLGAAWKRGDDIFAEVTLPDGVRKDAAAYGVHPALFDAALHTLALVEREDDRIFLPMEWNDVTLSASGAATLRVRMSPVGADTLSLIASDAAGNPVLRVNSMVVRQVSMEQIEAANASTFHQDLVRLQWQPARAVSATGRPSRVAEWNALDTLSYTPEVVLVETTAGATADAVYAATREMLTVLKAAFVDGRLGATTTLMVRTRRAVALAGEGIDDLAGAAVWGMVRSAQAENPGRIVLVDADTDVIDVAAVLACGESQLVVREGVMHCARIARIPVVDHPEEADQESARGGSVLVTGAPGGIGSLVARHLVTEHGVQRLLLASRRGMTAPGAEELYAELTGLGAKVEIVRCDVSNRDEVAELLAGERLTGVVHSAAALADGTLDSLTVEQLDTVLAPKVDAALHLHELTAGMDLTMFVLFSSAVGTFGLPGQANYAAANTFLDALAVQRRAKGLPAHSLAWGLWDLTSTDNLAEADRDRMLRTGIRAMSPDEGLALFDAALTLDDATVIPGRIDIETFAAAPQLAKLFSGLVPARTHRAAATETALDPAAGSRLSTQLAGLTDEDALDLLVDLVRTQAAKVLGGKAQDLAATESFQQSGFDSLMAVELRNGLRAATGLPVPVTAIFDNPNPLALAQYIWEEIDTAPVTVEHPQFDEAQIRELLAATPLDQLRAAGIVDSVLSLPRQAAPLPEVVRYPATRDVMRLLRSGQQGIPSAAHTVPMAFRLSRATTEAELDAALTGLAGRHAALRTAFLPSVEHHRDMEVRRDLPETMLRWSTVAECGPTTVQDRLSALLEEPFDLAAAPLWRFELLESVTGDQVLIFGAHHAVADAQSMLLVAAELDAVLQGLVPDSPASNRDIDDLIGAQQARTAPADDTSMVQWRNEFVGSRRLDLELAHPRPDTRTYRSAAHFVTLPDGLMDRVGERTRELGITPAAFFLGVLTVLLARRQQTKRFALAVPVDTRIHAESPTGIGYFGVPVPYPANVEDDEPVTEVLQRTAARLQRLLSKGSGFSDTLATLAAEGLYRGNAPLIEVYFNYLKSGAAHSNVEILPVGPGKSDLDLMATVMPDWGQVCFYYNLDIIDEASCAALGADYAALLSEVVDDPSVEALEPATDAEVTEGADKDAVVAVSATFALGKLPDLCRVAFDSCTIVEAPYHHVVASILDPAGVLSSPATDVGVVLLRASDFERFGALTGPEFDELAQVFPVAVQSLAARTRTPLIVGFLPSAAEDPRFAAWESGVIGELRDCPGIAVVEPDEWLRGQSVEEFFDEHTDTAAHLPFTSQFQAAVALTLSDLVAAAQETPPKVIAVDGDETLWSGIAGEIGPENVDLGGPRASLARRLLQWRTAGALLVLVSNNDDDIVRSVLGRPDSILKAEHFAIVSTGWNPKVERLDAAAQELRLGLDSFVFIDDNPVEVAAVRSALPEVHSLVCPAVDDVEAFLSRLWPLVPAAATAEDSARAEFYAHERQRDAVRAQTAFADFLEQLELEVDIAPISDVTVERGAQLMRRTNQFAMRKVDASALDSWRRSGEVWMANAKDRFGDYGLIGLVAVQAVAGELEVLGWHLSCRALGRGVEERILSWLADRADDLGCPTVRLTAQVTARNVPARKLIAALGGADIDAGDLDIVVTPARLRAFRRGEQQ
ncbi:SDR family NAD(P)-dependent oxidoreductase [Rhodococcus qingshengii]|uniref:SDR family NAD(P)-dependent oxidoreductase n=1 Tax=Rhodococcus qingshengii TaxID=334542 RepID=A0AAW6LT38_RHOSG|nr:type I polyketide synthase [Rhodococcus qingshengii]MDE8647603.1 SDR family NAD(P)-dependent oxidoreductase [Rhodococcus qingshengii]